MFKDEKEVGKEILKKLPDIKVPNKSWGGCDYIRKVGKPALSSAARAAWLR